MICKEVHVSYANYRQLRHSASDRSNYKWFLMQRPICDQFHLLTARWGLYRFHIQYGGVHHAMHWNYGAN